MKVLHINPYPPDHLGGSEIFCKNLALNLSNRGIECDILTSDIFRKKQEVDRINDYLKVIYKKFYFNLWGKNPLVNIYPYIKKNYFKYDIIQAHSYIFFTTMQTAYLRNYHKFPFLLHIHGGVDTPYIRTQNLFNNLQQIFKDKIFDRTFGKYVFEHADAIVSVSSNDKEIIEEKYKLKSCDTFYVPNGVNTSKFKNLNNFERKYITFIGRLSYIKGIDIFLKLIEDLYRCDNNLRFLIVGDGPLRDLVEYAKRDLPITHYKSYPYHSIQEIYNKSKILLMTSRFEGLPTTLLESLSCETPVLASNVGGISEIIENEFNGFLFEINNLQKIKEICHNIINDDNKLGRLGKSGREMIENAYSWKVITEKMLTIYRKIV